MSHQHISWGSQRREALPFSLTINNRATKMFKSKDAHKGYELVTESFLICDVLKFMSKVAQQQLGFIRSGEKKLSNPLGLFYCNPTRQMTQALGHLKTEVENPQLLTEEKKNILRQIDLKEEQLKEVYPKIESVVKGFFTANTTAENNQFLFHKDQNDAQVDQWQGKMAVESFNYLYRQLGAQYCGIAKLPEETLGILKIKEATFLSCFEYTLASVDAQVGSDFRKKGKEDALDDFLVEKGWRNVDAPDEGDLVIYYNHITKRIFHVGLYTERGTVLSKPGIANGSLFEHQPFDILGIYGTCIYFMRRSPTVKF